MLSGLILLDSVRGSIVENNKLRKGFFAYIYKHIHPPSDPLSISHPSSLTINRTLITSNISRFIIHNTHITQSEQRVFHLITKSHFTTLGTVRVRLSDYRTRQKESVALSHSYQHKMSTMSSSPFHSQFLSSPLKKQKKAMSVTQTYYLAHTARGKLSHEAARSDHNLRLLVGHANLLDSLMLELAEAEQEQESWFNQSVKKATKTEEPKHIQWADTVVEDPEEDWEAEDADSSDSESDYDSDEDIEMENGLASLQRVPSNHIISKHEEVDEELVDDGEEDFEGLALHLTHSITFQLSTRIRPRLRLIRRRSHATISTVSDVTHILREAKTTNRNDRLLLQIRSRIDTTVLRTSLLR